MSDSNVRNLIDYKDAALCASSVCARAIWQRSPAGACLALLYHNLLYHKPL